MSKPIVEVLCTKIRNAEAKGLTRYKLAQAAAVHQSQLTRLISGEVAPKLDTAEKIAKALGYRIVLVRLPNT